MGGACRLGPFTSWEIVCSIGQWSACPKCFDRSSSPIVTCQERLANSMLRINLHQNWLINFGITSQIVKLSAKMKMQLFELWEWQQTGWSIWETFWAVKADQTLKPRDFLHLSRQVTVGGFGVYFLLVLLMLLVTLYIFLKICFIKSKHFFTFLCLWCTLLSVR